MKNVLFYISAFILLLSPVVAEAQGRFRLWPNAETEKRTEVQERFAIREEAVRKHNGQLEIYLEVHDTGVPKLCTQEQVKIEFFINGSDGAMDLPPVLYTGKQRFRYAGRSLSLAGGEAMQPYRILRENGKNETDTMAYRTAVLFEEWMEHADLGYRMVFRDVRGATTQTEGVLITDLFPPLPPWVPDPKVYQAMAWFTPPAVEEVKRRSERIEIYPEYGRNEVEILARRGNNASELERLNEFLMSIAEDRLKMVDTLRLHFHGSPEGSYRKNERLMRQRAGRMERQFSERYGALKGRIVSEWMTEDWDALLSAADEVLRTDSLFQSADARAVIKDPDLDPDARERILKYIENGENWKILRDSLFSGLWRIGLEAEYVIRNLDDRQLRELAIPRPEYLSGEELYRAAFLHGAGSPEFIRVFETAAERFPDEWESLNNVAGAYLRAGDVENARRWLELLPDELTETWVNLGVYYYILGDPERAEGYFLRAAEAGIEQAEANLKLLRDSFDEMRKSE